MKTKIKVLSFLTVMVLSFGIFMNSCIKEELAEVEDSSLAMLKNGTVLEGSCYLVAGQNMIAGMVSHEIVGDEITVRYETNGWFLSEVHIYVGPKELFPINKKAIKVGHFTVGEEGLSGQVFEVTIPFDPEWVDPILVAHAIVNDGLGNEETAWGNCLPTFIVKAILEDGFWAVSSGNTEFQDVDDWCKVMGVNPFFEGTYDLVNGSGEKVGIINVCDDGVVEIIPDNEVEICKSYLHINDMDGVPIADDYCPNWGRFDYNIGHDEPFCSSTHIYEDLIIPESGSTSFEDAFGSSRWGWFLEL